MAWTIDFGFFFAIAVLTKSIKMLFFPPLSLIVLIIHWTRNITEKFPLFSFLISFATLNMTLWKETVWILRNWFRRQIVCSYLWIFNIFFIFIIWQLTLNNWMPKVFFRTQGEYCMFLAKRYSIPNHDHIPSKHFRSIPLFSLFRDLFFYNRKGVWTIVKLNGITWAFLVWPSVIKSLRQIRSLGISSAHRTLQCTESYNKIHLFFFCWRKIAGRWEKGDGWKTNFEDRKTQILGSDWSVPKICGIDHKNSSVTKNS